jgi:hypothetical protein
MGEDAGEVRIELVTAPLRHRFRDATSPLWGEEELRQ